MTLQETSRRRSEAWRLLDQPVLWEAVRRTLDATFGLYRRRIDVLRRWGIVQLGPSVLDIGCGIGQYAAVTAGPYVGVDITARYIERARRVHRDHPERSFRAEDVTTMDVEPHSFDIVLMVDFLHHLPDEACQRLLEAAARLSRRYVVSLEPVLEQTNRVGRWIIDHDRGDYMRPLADYQTLFENAPLSVLRDEQLYLGPISTRALLAAVSEPNEQA